jgi:hypothetical protein
MATKQEIIGWLEIGEPKFIRKLTEIGLKRGMGFHKVINGQVEREIDDGEYTGDGLCYFASGAIEAAIELQYGNEVETRGIVLSPLSKNTGKNAGILHHIMRILTTNGSLTTDATYRQLDFFSPNRLYIFPSEEESSRYRGREVRSIPRGGTKLETTQTVGRGFVHNITLLDFNQLVATLLS